MIQFLREVNSLLALLTVFGLAYRLPQAWQNVVSKRFFVALGIFPPIAGLASAQALVLNAPGGPITPVLTAAYLFLGWVCIRWPKRLSAQDS